MPNLGKSLLPKFSLAGLFWFASAVAIGFAVSQSTAAEEPDLWPSIAAQAFYSPTLLAIATVLVVYELVRQGMWLRRRTSDGDHDQFERQVAWVVRMILAAGAVGLLVLTQLINRQILVPTEPEGFVHFYGELWPGTMLTLLLLLVMRLMTVRSSATVEPSLKRYVSLFIVAAGIFIIGLYIITDRLLISWLVHVATDGVEKSHAVRWHRPDVFPHHAAEGFRSFWSAFVALLVVLSGGLSLMLTALVRRQSVTALLSILFVSSIVIAFGYSWWFVTHEFPRISPDLASEPTTTRQPDFVAGAVLLLGTAAVIGYQLAKLRIRGSDLPERSTYDLPQPSGLMAIAAGLIALGCGSDSLILAYDAIAGPFWWSVSDFAWVNALVSLVQYFIIPESLIVFAAAISGAGIVWQYYRPIVAPAPYAPVRGWHFVTYTLATVVLLTVAVPVLAAFGFCYWLGPWVL